MSGSGNDFVFFDNRTGAHQDLLTPAVIGALCDRRRGVGADGVVVIDASSREGLAFGMRYYNRDGSLAEMCGNAALCSASLARELGITGAREFSFDTPSGPVTARVAEDGVPEIDMVPLTELTPRFETPLESGERRVGYARVGVPHLVVLCDDVETVDVVTRGRTLRNLPQLPEGANVNFVARDTHGAWSIRTYERGVEDETDACGTGTVAAVALLSTWGLAPPGVSLATRSGCDLYASTAVGQRSPVLRGEGRVAFTGLLREFDRD
jgi:diaminopimelate epimerase